MTHDPLDRLQAAWPDFDRRLVAQERRAPGGAAQRGLASMRQRLWPLAGGQLAQLPVGIGLIALAVAVETSAAVAPARMAAAVTVHAYGVAIVAWALMTLVMLWQVDPARPVVEVQERLLRLHRAYLVGTVVLGLAWWLMWIPFLATLAAWLGLDGYMAHLQPAMHWILATSAAGFGATLLLCLRARTRPALRDRLLRLVSAGGLVDAEHELRGLVDLRTDAGPTQVP